MPKKSLKKNFIFNFLYQIILLGIPLVISPYLTRHLGEDAIGEYAYTYSIVSLFLIAINLGISQYGTRKIAINSKEPEKVKKYFWEIFDLRIIVFSIVLMFYFLMIVFSNDEEQTLYLIMIMVLASAVFDITWFYNGLENFLNVIIKNVIIRVMELVLIFLLVKSPGDLKKYTAIMSISVLIGSISLMPKALKIVGFTKVSFKDILKHLKPILILSISVISISIYSMLDKTILGLYYPNDKSMIAFYEYAEKIVKIPNSIITTLALVIMPHISKLISENKIEEVHSKAEKANFLLYFLACGACFGLCGISNILIPLYYGENFSICVEYIIALSPIIIIIPMGAMVRNVYLIPYNKDIQYVSSMVAAAILNLILNFLLIRPLGVYGAIIGTVIAELIGLILQLIFVRKQISVAIHIFNLIPFLLIGIATFFSIRVFQKVEMNIYLMLGLDFLVGTTTYLVLSCIYIIIFKKEYWNIIIEKIKKIIYKFTKGKHNK